MTLKDIITGGMQYDNKWSIYIDSGVAVSPKMEARVGQNQFECGGVIDGKIELISLMGLIDELNDYTDGDDDADINDFADEFIYDVLTVIAEQNDDNF